MNNFVWPLKKFNHEEDAIKFLEREWRVRRVRDNSNNNRDKRYVPLRILRPKLKTKNQVQTKEEEVVEKPTVRKNATSKKLNDFLFENDLTTEEFVDRVFQGRQTEKTWGELAEEFGLNCYYLRKFYDCLTGG